MAKFVVTWGTPLGTSGSVVVFAAHSAILEVEPREAVQVDIRSPILSDVEQPREGQSRYQRPVAS